MAAPRAASGAPPGTPPPPPRLLEVVGQTWCFVGVESNMPLPDHPVSAVSAMGGGCENWNLLLWALLSAAFRVSFCRAVMALTSRNTRFLTESSGAFSGVSLLWIRFKFAEEP